MAIKREAKEYKEYEEKYKILEKEFEEVKK